MYIPKRIHPVGTEYMYRIVTPVLRERGVPVPQQPTMCGGD